MPTPSAESPSYFLLLEALLSAIPDSRLSANTGDWCAAILQLREKYGEKYSDLFDDIRLIERPPLKPVSPEVGDFIAWIQAGGDAGVWNPTYDIMEAGDAEKARIRERVSGRLGRYSEVIAEMATDIRGLLAYKEPVDDGQHNRDVTGGANSVAEGAA